MKPQRLIDVEHDKRKVKDEPIFLDANFLTELEQMVQQIQWPYKSQTDLLQLRDKAIVCFFILTGIRNSERTQLTKKQFRDYPDRILVVNVQPLKHGDMREEIILPKTGDLAFFTKIFAEWLEKVPAKDSIVFPTAYPNGELNWNQSLGRQRVHWIVKTQTGMFPHWFRGVCESIYGRIIFKNDAWALKDFMGLRRLDSTSPYVSGQWKAHEKDVFNAKIT